MTQHTNTSSLESFQVLAPGLVEQFPQGISATVPEMVRDAFQVRVRVSGVNPRLASEHVTSMCQGMIHDAIEATEKFIGRPATQAEAHQAWNLAAQSI